MAYTASVNLQEVRRSSRLDAEYTIHPKKNWLKQLVETKRFTPLGRELRHLSSGHTPYRHDMISGDVGFITVECIDSLYLNWDKLKRITNEQFEEEFRINRIIQGSLVCTIKRRICKAYPFLTPMDRPLAMNQDVAYLIPKPDVRAGYIAAYLNSEVGQTFADRQKTEQMNPYISVSNLAQLPIHLPSPEFQIAIEERLVEAYRSLDESYSAMDQSDSNLLTQLDLSNWRPEEPISFIKPYSIVARSSRMDAEHFQPKFDVMINKILETRVELVPLGKIIHPIKNGIDIRDYVEEGIPYIRVGDIKKCQIDLDGARKVSIRPGQIRKDIALHVGDVLFTRKGSYGNAALVRDGEQHVIISSEIMLIRIKREWENYILPDYLAVFFNSICGSYQAEKWAHGVAFYSIAQDDLNRFLIPIIPYDQQLRIKECLDRSESHRHDALNLLSKIKRAVDTAILEDEDRGLEVLG